MKVRGKVALITGAARGLGRAFAEGLLEHGAKVLITDIIEDLLHKTAQDLRAKYGSDRVEAVVCDVTDKNQLADVYKRVVRTFHGLDIVINNAGINNEKTWRKMIDINLSAVIESTYCALEIMRKDTGGAGGLIINIASTGGLVPAPSMLVYGASKHGVVGFTKNLPETFPEVTCGVRFSCLCPSFTYTDMMNEQLIKESLKMSQDPAVAGAVRRMKEEHIDTLGVMQPGDVVRGLLRLVEDDRAQGGVLAVTPMGLYYAHPKHLKGKL